MTVRSLRRHLERGAKPTHPENRSNFEGLCGDGRVPHFEAVPPRFALLAAAAALALGSCSLPPHRAPLVVHTAPPPSAAERYCAWYGAADDAGILYFGTSAFWSAAREHGGDPRADLLAAGPKQIGRFDLRRERLLEPLELDDPGRAGVWDVLPVAGRVYFTSYFEAAGALDLASGELLVFRDLGAGLNELAQGPRGNLLASRYASADGGDGSVVEFDGAGRLLRELPLAAPPGYRVAAKTVAYDPRRDEVWVTTDLLPERGGSIRHDARVLDALSGAERRRIEDPELQFVHFAPDGVGYLAERDADGLHLRILPPPGEAGAVPVRLLLDPDFPAALDFAQDLQLAPGGEVVVTRWSGRVHLVDRRGRVRTLALPRLDADGLYYTALRTGARVCATYCGGVRVVCAPAP